MTEKRILHKIKLDEISAVDVPAQEHATVAILKRQHTETLDEDPEIEKEGPRGPDNLVAPPDGEPNMPEDTSLEMVLEQHEALKKEIARLKAMLDLEEDERDFVEGMEEEVEKSSFLNSSKEDREALMSKAKDADPVVYTALDGSEFHKSDDSRVVAAVKRADLMEKNLKKEMETRENLEMEKRAKKELSHLPGESKVHVAILKALGTIDDEVVRQEALNSIRAGSHSMAKNFETRGTSEQGIEKSCSGQLDDMAKRHADQTGKDFHSAYDYIIQTPEGSKLYEKAFA